LAALPLLLCRIPNPGGRHDVDRRQAARAEARAKQIEKNPGANEREEIERILAKIETALSLLGPCVVEDE
jgi:hypothetical protein